MLLRGAATTQICVDINIHTAAVKTNSEQFVTNIKLLFILSIAFDVNNILHSTGGT